jgi:hypothetical protein
MGLRIAFAIALVGCSYEPQAAPASEPDAAPSIDAFDPADCAATYTFDTGTSRYRVIDLDRSFLAQHLECKSDGNHLVVYDTDAERTAIRTALGDSDRWVGFVQAPDQSRPELGWSAITGGEALMTFWETPDDDDDVENNEQNTALDQSDGVDDKSAGETHGAICECDGRAIDTTVENQIPGI